MKARISRAALCAALLGAAVRLVGAAWADDAAEAAQHVPPEPALTSLAAMPSPELSASMQMDDTARTGRVLLEQLEWRDTDAGNAAVWEGFAWYGGDYDKLWLRTEGERVHGTTENARLELLWDHSITRWWNLQAGTRADFGNGPSRGWVAFGVQGLAPYWFDVEATAYAGGAGRTAARLRVEYDLLLTQRCIVQPEAEMILYGKPDPDRQLGSGLSDLEAGIRVRYEIRREFAPYIGMAWRRLFGATVERTRTAGFSASDLQLLAGVRLWF
jgi:copper resistance protein B